MFNIQLICNELKNKAYYIFDKGGVKKDGQGGGCKKATRCFRCDSIGAKMKSPGLLQLIYNHGKH